MSTEKQIKGDSLRRQMEWSEDFARRNNLELQDASSFADIGVSAWKGLNRSKGRLGAFIELAREGVIPNSSFLLIENLDRLSRTTPLDALDLFKEILRLGITVVARGEYGDEETYTWQSLNSNSNQLMSTLTTMLRANRESERKSQIIREAFENKRVQSRQGKKTNHAPPSWITATKLSKGEYAYALNDRAGTVEWIFEKSAEGWGFDRIARSLNEQGVPTFRPSKQGWWYTNVRSVVTNRAAIGEYQSLITMDGKYEPKGDPIPNYYPAVVGNDLWFRAQKLVHRNRKPGRAGTTFSNLVNGLATCAHCQGDMIMLNNSRSGKQWRYLVCANHFRKTHHEVGNSLVPVCSDGTARFRYDLIEKLILDNISEFGLSDQMRLARTSEAVGLVSEALATAEIELTDIRRRESRLLALLEDEDEEEIPGLKASLRKRSDERQKLEKRVEELTQERDVLLAKQTAMDPADTIAAMRERWQTAEDDDTRYSLRVRTNTAMRDFIDFISFDSISETWTVILFGGFRAYMFANIKGKTAATTTIRPAVVDMAQQLDQVPLTAYLNSEEPISPLMQATFDRIAQLRAIRASFVTVAKNDQTTVVGKKR